MFAGAEGDDGSSSISTLDRSLAARRPTRGKMIPMDSQTANTRKSYITQHGYSTHISWLHMCVLSCDEDSSV